MSFVVTGYVGTVAYTAVVDADRAATADAAGCVTGSPNVLALLRENEGEPVDVTPTGPFLTLDLQDPATVLAALHHHTQIVEVTGDAPDLFGDGGPRDWAGVVY